MAFEQRDMTGTLFRNESDNEKAPSHKGKIMVGGVEYPIAAWIKEGQKGRFFSIKVEEPREQRQASGGDYQPRQRTPGEHPMPQRGGGPKKPISAGLEDDIPFSAEVR
ncbi:hypothetical protein [Pseudoroseomonas ludipueritiae]|uniref:DUF736 domain-containing protein n=1 Tax=Pseudoroseomonas ludipueritiae TaxID=198093 RepID=A0ABR7R542_9PROT|nr:hypothetical protein [Pseudoroseomonas ludipueritiae]MBC9176787.1 hypothetical protein [Pseudoroseomonas ludipueritiae]